MSLAQTHELLRLPATLEIQLHEFRRRVWSIKTIEAVCAAVFGVMVAFLVTFAFDRAWDTPVWVRLGLLAAAGVGCAIIPYALHRWIWRNRHLEQLARLLTRKHPHIGDQLLGIIELAHNDFEQARSRTLCQAAIKQVAEDAQKRDFRDAVPNPKHRFWAGMAIVPTVVALVLFAVVPAAASNAWARFATPWKETPRYTFAAVEALPEQMVVAHGEPYAITAKLTDETMWRPASGVVKLDHHVPIVASLRDGQYTFELPARLEPAVLDIRIGDNQHRVRIEPTLRPELTSVVADVALPAYLSRPEPQKKDVRGGAISLVKGTQASFSATASRALASAAVDGKQRMPDGSKVTSPSMSVDASRKVEFQWKDRFGLAGREPFTLTVTGRDDEAPSLICEDLPRQKVVLDTEQLSFKVRAQDDFGIKKIGMEWAGYDDPVIKNPAKGERILAAGGTDKESLDVAGGFSAHSLGIEPQPVNLRIFAEDYFPGRPRVYSPTYTLYVLNAEQHAIWLTEQLSKWHKQSLEVRDRELQLHETNKQLRALGSEQLDQPENRRKVESQASAERANGRRLSNLVNNGEELVRQAMRNPEFGVGHLEKWAEMLQILKDIAGSRMPSVADLLKQASQAPVAAAKTPPATSQKMAGQIRSSGSGKEAKPSSETKKQGTAPPKLVDMESSQQPRDKTQSDEPPPKANPNPAPFRLPVTTVMGSSKPKKNPPTEAEKKVDEAVKKQQDLLAEFDKIADELNRVLANLEGSTLVKRLKAASRLQYKIGGRIVDQVNNSFGQAAARVDNATEQVLSEMAKQESKGSEDLSFIMDDMQAYFERRQFVKFKKVLDEMKQQDVVGSLRQLGDDLKKENGVSIAQCEYWSDTMDRWADDLVDAGCCGTCNAKSKASLPPAIVLEVLQILEGEVNLREETRVAQQARPALAANDYRKQAGTLSTTQDGLHGRVEKVTQQIRELPDSEVEFPKEIALLQRVAAVMDEATEILARPETGKLAIAAETEVIELLLQSKRINPKGGGGGGSSPGGGGTGTTIDSALALLGTGTNDKEVREDRGIQQSTGESGPVLPEEFRSGLDEYFNRLESRPSGGQ
jgi:hypothetical protein